MPLTNSQKDEALDDLKKLKGLPPYDNWSNICYGDGYFAQSIVSRFGMSISELEKETGLDKREKKYRKAKAKLAKKLLL